MDDLNSIFIRQINEKQENAFHELFLRFFNYLCHEASTATGCGGGYCAGGFRECVGGR